MVVEALFWFHPLVWWVGARLVYERERACDQGVLALGSEPEAYAESILKTCEYYVESPLTCVAGVTGADLKRRIEAIMSNHARLTLSMGRKCLLATIGIGAIAAPLVVGTLAVPRAQAAAAAPQSTPMIVSGGPEFDVASIRQSGPDTQQAGIQPILPGGRFTAVGLPLRVYLRLAYGTAAALLPDQVVGGPDWLDKERFDIKAVGSALTAPDASPRTLYVMLQRLLAERFRVRAHVETRQLPIYILVRAKPDGSLGPQLRPTAGGCRSMVAAPTREQAALPICGFTRVAPGVLSGVNVPMSLLSGVLAGQPDVERVVRDGTNLTDGFDLDLEFTPIAAVSGSNPNAPPSLFTALQQQLGLKLDPTRGPVDVLVIDHAERPSDNQAEPAAPQARPSTQAPSPTATAALVSAQAPAAPTAAPARLEFEAISVKPNKSGDWRKGMGPAPGGRFTATNVTFRELVPFAYGISQAMASIRIIGGPTWIDTDRFDIVATTRGGASPTDMSTMLRAALADRFSLSAHHDTRLLPIYALVMARRDRAFGPKLRPSEVTEAGCAARREALRRNEPVPTLPSGVPVLCGSGRSQPGDVAAVGFSIGWLVDTLAPYVNRVVLDQTGLSGRFDFDLHWTPDSIPAPRPDDPNPLRIDPNGPSIFTAAQEQLGLKLESTTGPVDVLVIDSVEKPSEN